MRRTFPSFFRLVALFLVMTIMNSGLAMAAYVCPQLTTSPAQARMMEGMPCAGMDKENPVHCGEYKSGAKASSDHLGTPPELAAISVAFVFPVPALFIPRDVEAFFDNTVTLPSTDPPYVQTQRFRI
ncbi:hypothetical protein [Rugamonas sp.]|uniref:hypothetical protein n=1 Tax=Rugamonas sp. TaxID=1926287 RepID=UPI0025DF0499|nr:hypothetical protein [Rugamonas sp.]